MNAKLMLAQAKQAAATLQSDWPRGADLAPWSWHIYTGPNAPRDLDMLVLAETLHLRGAKVVLYDINTSTRRHNLRTIPCVVVDREGVEAARVEVDDPAQVDIVAWLAPGGPLDPKAIEDRAVAAQAALSEQQTLWDEEAMHQQASVDLVGATVAATVPPAQAAVINALLRLAPPERVAEVARDLVDALTPKEPQP